MILEICIGGAVFFAGAWAGAYAATRPERDINVVDGMILPSVDDPRWKPTKLQFGDDESQVSMRLGDIMIRVQGVKEPLLFVGFGTPSLSSGANYAKSVVRAHQQRIALTAMTEAE